MHVLRDFLNIQVSKAAAMATGALASSVLDCRGMSAIGWQMKWTGTPVGAFTMQVSNDYLPGNTPLDPARNAGTWETVTPTTAINTGGAAGDSGWNVPVNHAFARLVYTGASSTGVLNAWGCAKG